MEPNYLTRDQFEYLLKKGTTDFTNSYVKGETFKQLSFPSVHGIQFIDCHFEKVNIFEMDQVKFQHCTMNECDLYRSNLKNTSFWQCSLYGCDLTEATLAESTLARSSFVNLVLSGADLAQVSIERCVFETVTLTAPIKGLDTLQITGNDAQIGNCLLSLKADNKSSGSRDLIEAMQQNIEALVNALETDHDVDAGDYERTCSVIQAMKDLVSEMKQHSPEQKRMEEPANAYDGAYDSKKELRIAGYRPTKELLHTIETVNLAFQTQLSVSDIRYLCSFKTHFTDESRGVLEKAATVFRDQERSNYHDLER